MAITNVSAARRAGFKITNKGIKKAAAIAMSKIGTRQLYLGLPVNAFHTFGAFVSPGATFGVFPATTLQDGGGGSMVISIPLPAEAVSNFNVYVHIFWKTTQTNTALVARFAVDMASRAVTAATTSESSQIVTTAADATAGRIIKTTLTFSGIFTAGDILGLLVTRDGADAADTLAADVQVLGVVIEFTGRG